jgi:hypothetical protein
MITCCIQKTRMYFDLLQGVTEGLVSHLIFESCNAKEVTKEYTDKVRILLLAIINTVCKNYDCF